MNSRIATASSGALTLIGLLALPAIAREPVGAGSETAADWIERLGDDSQRAAAAHALGELKANAAVAPLMRHLRSNDAITRREVIIALGNIGDPRAVERLIPMLFEELPGISFSFEARHALIQIGPAAVPAVMQLLARKNKEVEAIRTPAGEQLAPGAIEAKASVVLGALRAREAGKPMVEALLRLRHDNAGNMVSASVLGATIEICYALGLVGAREGIPILRKLSRDGHSYVRPVATESLTALRATDALPAQTVGAGPLPTSDARSTPCSA